MTDTNNTNSPALNNTAVDLSKLKNKIKSDSTEEGLAKQVTAEPVKIDSPEHKQIVEEFPAETLQEAQQFQHYKSSRNSTRMITSSGKKIAFCNFALYTQDEDIIDYLDHEIKQNKLLGITKGALMSVEDKDPMAALKSQHIAEYLETEAKKASDAKLGKTVNMGNTKPAGAAKINPAHSGNVAR